MRTIDAQREAELAQGAIAGVEDDLAELPLELLRQHSLAHRCRADADASPNSRC